MGIGKAPMVMIYESQFLEYLGKTGNKPNPDMVLLYLRPTIINKEVFVAISEGGRALADLLGRDPVLQGVRWIAEPWDVGPSGYQLGQFPRGWQEWNDRYRDTARAFWLGGDCTRGEFALRLAGSSDLYQPRNRSPLSKLNS
jgi:hypothetical protein